MKTCPSCQEPLKDGAIVCTHCGHQLADIPAVAEGGFTPTPNVLKIGCGLLILAAFAFGLWVFSSSYQAESPAGANAMDAPALEDR